MLEKLVLVLCLTGLSGCCFEDPKPFEEEIPAIERVMVNGSRNGTHAYTLFIREPGNQLRPRRIEANEVMLFTDVEEGKPMWAIYSGFIRKELGEPLYLRTKLVVHIHSAKELKGGELDNGKFGIETTVPVE